MDIRRPLTVLVYALPVLVVAFAVLMGGYALSLATNDQIGAAIYWRVAMFSLMLVVGNILLLVGTLGLHALTRSDRTNEESSDRGDSVP